MKKLKLALVSIVLSLCLCRVAVRSLPPAAQGELADFAAAGRRVAHARAPLCFQQPVAL